MRDARRERCHRRAAAGLRGDPTRSRPVGNHLRDAARPTDPTSCCRARAYGIEPGCRLVARDRRIRCALRFRASGASSASTRLGAAMDPPARRASRFRALPSAISFARSVARCKDSESSDLAFTIGGSLGGMRALQWALAAPQCVGGAIVVGAHDHHSAMGIALNALQREALELDPVAACAWRANSRCSRTRATICSRAVTTGALTGSGVPSSTSRAISIIKPICSSGG